MQKFFKFTDSFTIVPAWCIICGFLEKSQIQKEENNLYERQ